MVADLGAIVSYNLALIFGMILLDIDRLPNEPFDLPQLIALVTPTERRGDARRACPARAANAMHVNFRHIGQLEVDHV